MGWHQISKRIALSSTAVTATPLLVSRRATRPPRPPAWATRALRQRPPTAQTRVETPPPAQEVGSATATSAQNLREVSWSSTNFTQQAHHPTPSHQESNTVRSRDVHSTGADFATASALVSSGTFNSFAFNATPAPITPPLSPSQTQRIQSGMRSHLGAFNGDAPPPNSYAYLHSKSDSTPLNSKDGNRGKSVSPATGAAVSSSPSAEHTMVSVEGETSLIAAAPGAVRRALLHKSTSSTESNQPAFPSSSVVSSPASAFQSHIVRILEGGVGLNAANHAGSGVADEGLVSAPLTPAERRARQAQQRRTREARERRRLMRGQQSSGDALHPCRLQGGCYHRSGQSNAGSSINTDSPTGGFATAAGACPYRHYPADHCLEQLREGRCALHDVGCCPWTHSDVVEGSARRFSCTSADGTAGVGPFARINPLEAVCAKEELGAVRQSAEKVGQLLRLCVDAVVASIEEAAVEHQLRFLESDASPQRRQCALVEALHAMQKGPTLSSAGKAHLKGLLYVEMLKSRAGSFAVLSVPSDFAWCAMARDVEGRGKDDGVEQSEGLTFFEDEKSLVNKLEANDATTAHLAAAEMTPMSKAECAYWSSFFIYHADAFPSVSTSAVVSSAAGSERANSNEEVLGFSPSTVNAGSRIRLTPCVSAWVVDAAAAQLRREAAATTESLHGSVNERHRGAESFPIPTSPHVCFQHVMLYLLGWRRRELQQYLLGSMYQDSDASAPKSSLAEGQDTHIVNTACGTTQPHHARADEGRWAPVLLLRDMLVASYISASQSGGGNADEALGRHSSLENDGTAGVQEEVRGADFAPPDACDSLLSVFLLVSSSYDEPQKQSEVDALLLRGSRFSLREPVASPTSKGQRNENGAVPGTCHKSALACRNRTPHSAAALSTTFEAAWSHIHSLIVQLQWGLLNCPSQTPSSSLCLAPLLVPSSISLSLFVQPAVLQLVAAVTTTFAAYFEAPLRAVTGWQPWTDQQLFVKAHAAVYNASTYARHYLPVVRLGLHNSLLNSLLILSTCHTSAVFRMAEPSEVRKLLLLSTVTFPWLESEDGGVSTSVTPSVAARWWAAMHQAEHRFRQQHLQRTVSLSLGFLTALQELSRQQLKTQQLLMQQYEQRRSAYAVADTALSDFDRGRIISSSTKGGLKGNDNCRSGGRTRKYHTPSQAEQQAEQRARLEELRGVPLLDRLLPYGSATVSPDAAACLLRHLLEGGHPYKALKLAASIVHASRMLRHADKQPRPVLQQGYRTVHTRVWSKKLLRHVLVKKRVPVLRLVGDVEEGEESSNSGNNSKPGVQSRCGVRPVGLAFILSPSVVTEIARVGLRMGEAGAQLVDGIQQDCLRGALVDFTDGRGLPVPTLADVEAALQNTDAFSVDGVALHDTNTPSLSSRVKTPSVVFLMLFRQEHQQSNIHFQPRRSSVRGSAGDFLRLVGAGDAQSSRSFLRSSSLNPRRLNLQEDEEGRGAPHRRIIPTPLLLETLQVHTPPSDTARHTTYLRFFLQDVPHFTTWSVLFALQYQACERHSRYGTAHMDSTRSAARAMQTVYVMSTTALCGNKVGSRIKSRWSVVAGNELEQTTSASKDGHNLVPSQDMLNNAALHRHLAQEAEAMTAQVQAWILSDPSSFTTHERRDGNHNLLSSSSLSSSRLRIKDVKAMLSCVVDKADGAFERNESEGAVVAPKPRRAKLQLPVLLHHIWTTTVEHRSAQQRCIALWSVCAATLLGITNSALSASFGRHNDYCISTDPKAGEDDNYMCLALHHSYVAAGVLMPSHAPPQQAAHFVDATVRALLLSPALASREAKPSMSADVTSTFSSSSSSSSGEWPMLLSSARTPVVSTLREFVQLQCTLLSLFLAESTSINTDEVIVSHRNELQALLDAFIAAHGGLSESMCDRPAWHLFQPLLRRPALAHRWLLDTFLYPSPAFLVWLVAAVARTDAEGYAVLHTWLLHLPDAHRVTVELRQTLLKETQRRHRGALTRNRHHCRHDAQL